MPEIQEYFSHHVVVFQYEEMPEIQEYFSRQIEIMKQQATVFDLGSCLIKPVQRVLKYPLLLNELIQVQFSSYNFKQKGVYCVVTKLQL